MVDVEAHDCGPEVESNAGTGEGHESGCGRLEGVNDAPLSNAC